MNTEHEQKVVATELRFREERPELTDTIVSIQNFTAGYDKTLAVKNISLDIVKGATTAIIGASGCGKSSLLRAVNRLNELRRGAWHTGTVIYRGVDLYQNADPVEVRRRIGMVFQQPNPFPKSIYDNVAYGPRLLGIKKRNDLDPIVEDSLRRSYLWDEVKDRLKKSGLSLSGGQQQRLCIARNLAVSPDVLLMDEPCSALDPIATKHIEELMFDLEKSGLTILVVTHNMAQAARISLYTAFLNVREDELGRYGVLVEYDKTRTVFSNPKHQETHDYVSGLFG